MFIAELFRRHPREAGETYLQHLRFASWVGVRMAMAALAALVHGMFPFLFPRTASRLLREVAGMIGNRAGAAGPVGAADWDI